MSARKQAKVKGEMTQEEAVRNSWLGDTDRIRKIGLLMTVQLPDGRFVEIEIRRTNHGKNEVVPFEFFALVSETSKVTLKDGRAVPTTRVVYKETFDNYDEAKTRLAPKIFNFIENGSLT